MLLFGTFDSESLLWAAGTLFAVGLFFTAMARGFRLDKLGAFGLELHLQKPIELAGRRPFYAAVLLSFGLAVLCGGIGAGMKMFPPRWPTKYANVETAELLAEEIDDIMQVHINNRPIYEGRYGDTPDWINVKEALKQGANKIEVLIQNGRYGGCGGSLKFRLNGLESDEYKWSWGTARGITEDKLPDIVCYQEVKTIPLN